MISSNQETQKEHEIHGCTRLALAELRIHTLEKNVVEIKELLQEVRDLNLKTKTFIGALTVVISGVWLIISTFKEAIIHFIAGK